MTTALQRVIAPAVLCLLIAVHPVLSLYARNPGQSPFPWTMTAALAAAMVGLAIALGWAWGDRDKGALLVGLGAFLALNYGHVFDGIQAALRAAGVRPSILRHSVLALTFLLIFVVGAVILAHARRPLGWVRHVCTAVAVAAVGLAASHVVLFHLRAAALPPAPLSSPPAGAKADSEVGKTLMPSIYYVILDGRASSRVLEEYFRYSDAEFTRALRQRGFYIAERSHANYAWTFLSLASSLNMQYLDRVSEAVGPSNDPSVPYWMIANSKVASFLKAGGYRFVNVSSGWGPTNAIRAADENINVGDPLAEFYDVFLHTTIARPYVSVGAREYASGRIQRSFAGLRTIEVRRHPLFVFAHVMAPHPPFVFGRGGEAVRPKTLGLRAPWTPREAYVDQLVFSDRAVLQFVDRVLSESDPTPMVIIQSDHGPASSGSINRPTPELIRERMPIFNAYLVPAAVRNRLYDTISPVNSFRVVFSQTFGADFPLLKDEAYFSKEARPYQWHAVTSELLR